MARAIGMPSARASDRDYDSMNTPMFPGRCKDDSGSRPRAINPSFTKSPHKT
jgi:hypothetical protein